MKRGLITWDPQELPRSVLETRIEEARAALAARDLPALLIYTDIWRANQARYFTNFMPYWNRSLAVIPRQGAPVLLCGLSPRVYPWIRSVTIFEEIRPANKLAAALAALCEERRWSRLGVLDLPRLPQEIRVPVAAVDVPLTIVDESARAMHRRAAGLARKVLEEHLAKASGLTDHQFTGRLERAYRRAGAEDLMVLISTGESVPLPARGIALGEHYSVTVMLEYRGHWAKVTRAHAPPNVIAELESRFAGGEGDIENLSGPYPFESGAGPLQARHVAWNHFYYGDTLV
jgi:hypothetical protein